MESPFSGKGKLIERDYTADELEALGGIAGRLGRCHGSVQLPPTRTARARCPCHSGRGRPRYIARRPRLGRLFERRGLLEEHFSSGVHYRRLPGNQVLSYREEKLLGRAMTKTRSAGCRSR
jgi:hypothetical protein